MHSLRLTRLTRLHRFGATPLIAALLAVALWFASTMGLVHGVVHGSVQAPGVTQATEQTATGASSAAAARSAVKVARTAHITGFAALFADHSDGDAQCRLYDQLSHGPAAIAVPLIVLPLVLPTATFDFFQGEVLARWVALFQARGPPSSR